MGQPAVTCERPDRVGDELKVDMSSCRRTKPIDGQRRSLRFRLKVPQLAGPGKKAKNGWRTICHHIIAGLFLFDWIAATSSEPFQEGLLEASQQAMVDLLNSLDMLGSCASFLRAISPVLRII
jgi:hypothetical protein